MYDSPRTVRVFSKTNKHSSETKAIIFDYFDQENYSIFVCRFIFNSLLLIEIYVFLTIILVAFRDIGFIHKCLLNAEEKVTSTRIRVFNSVASVIILLPVLLNFDGNFLMIVCGVFFGMPIGLILPVIYSLFYLT